MKKFRILTAMSAGVATLVPLIPLTTSCGYDINKLAQELSKSVIEEFKEFSKHPHPSFHLDEIRSYLTNKLNSYGYEVTRDNYGNIWFDIPATRGQEKLPKLALQAHMDMVMRGIPEQEYPYTAPVLVEDKDADGRPIIHAKDKLTSIGADDGIGVATILAIANSTSIAHGPLRGIITADEEEGLFGAEALSSAALDGIDYLLNIDGEGSKAHEYIIERGCSGLCEYWYNKQYTSTTDSSKFLTYKYEIEIKGFKGGHFNDDENIIYGPSGPILRGNADRFLLDILWALTDGYGVQIAEFNHKADVGEDDTTFEPRHLPTHARVTFATNADAATVATVINYVYEGFKSVFKGEDWSKIAIPTAKSATITSVIDTSNSEKLVELFASCPISVEHWEGETEIEKVRYNYPTKSSNISTFTVKDGQTGFKNFSMSSRGVSGTSPYSHELTQFFSTTCQSVFAKEEITCKKDYEPWDAGDKTKLIELVKEGFEKHSVSPYIERTRGGLEPACFSKKRPSIQQACVGPRIDNIHVPGETLYVDTIPTVMKSILYVLQNLGKIA